MGKTVQLGKPKLIEPLSSRISAVKDGLLAAYRAGRGSPNEIVGNEREIFLKRYLEDAYPPAYRFSSGFIIDSGGSKSGQLDIIVERIHSISFPAQAGGEQRLYLAEMVSSAISVKSNLSSQWNQVVSEVDKLNAVHSEPTGSLRVNSKEGRVPLFVVAYSGAKTLKALKDKVEALPKGSCLRALTVLDSDIYAVQTEPDIWVYNQNTSSFFYFICDLHNEMVSNFAVGESIWKYACEISN